MEKEQKSAVLRKIVTPEPLKRVLELQTADRFAVQPGEKNESKMEAWYGGLWLFIVILSVAYRLIALGAFMGGKPMVIH